MRIAVHNLLLVLMVVTALVLISLSLRSCEPIPNAVSPQVELGLWHPTMPEFVTRPIHKVSRLNSLVLQVTAYCLPGITASGTQTRVGIIALSQDLLRRYTPGAPYRYGDSITLSGVGDFVIEDTMDTLWTNRADIWMPTRAEALEWGIRKVTVSKPPPRG